MKDEKLKCRIRTIMILVSSLLIFICGDMAINSVFKDHPRVKCSDFKTQKEAQIEKDKGAYWLDGVSKNGKRDGIACQSLLDKSVDAKTKES